MALAVTWPGLHLCFAQQRHWNRHQRLSDRRVSPTALVTLQLELCKTSKAMSEPYTWGSSQSWEELLLDLVRFSWVRSSDCWKNIASDKSSILMGSAQLPCDPLSNTATPWDVTTQNCRTISCVIAQDPRLGCGYLLIHKGTHLPRSGVACPCAVNYRHAEIESLIIPKCRLLLSLTWLHVALKCLLLHSHI